jgi:hypothetical protein
MQSNSPIRSSLIRADSLESFDDRRHFLEILHQLLDESESSGQQQTISWTSDGRSFAIHDSDKFENFILPAYFFTSSTMLTSYKSFLGQIKTYGFYRSNKNTFNHPMFVRGKQTKLFSRRKSVESWPMPNLALKGSAEEKNKRLSSSLTFPRQTISDLKKRNNSFLGRRRSSIVRSNSPEGNRRLSFKDTLLRRRRSSSGLKNINQSAYLEILRDLSISERPQPSKDVTTSPKNFSNDTDDLSVTDLEPLDICHAEDVVQTLSSSFDVEPLTMNHTETEEDTQLFDDTALFDEIEDDTELFNDIADALGVF